MNIKDVTGKRFGRLIAIKRIPQQGLVPLTHYKCQCDCGEFKVVEYKKLQNKHTRSCGCLQKESRFRKRSSNEDKYLNKKWCSYRGQAKRRELEWNLTKSQFASLVKDICFYCNSLSPTGYVGIDRLNSKKGYYIGNCVSACFTCNYAKGTKSVKEFKKWIAKVHNNFIRKIN